MQASIPKLFKQIFTNLTDGMVREVSATLVDTTHRRDPSGAF